MKSGRCGDDRDGEGDYDKDRGVARSIMDHVMGEHYWCFEEEVESMNGNRYFYLEIQKASKRQI